MRIKKSMIIIIIMLIDPINYVNAAYSFKPQNNIEMIKDIKKGKIL